jgi:AcrR family transcriptional regulator
VTVRVDREHATAGGSDGRAARRDRNRNAVLDAMVAMFSEGDLDPTPEGIAARVGLSARSVYRYFDDREALVRAAIDRQLEQVWSLYLIPAIGQGPLDDRIVRFVACRLDLYEAIAATARASRTRASTDAVVRDQVELTRRALRVQIEKHFAPELSALPVPPRRARVAALDALCELEALDHYRVHRGFSSATTRSMLIDTLHILLTH